MADLPLGQLTGFGGDQTVPWPVLAGAVLYPAALLAPWRGRRAVTTVLVIASGAMLADQLLTPGPPTSQAIAMLAKLPIPMGALATLSGGPVRLPRSWAWLLGVAPAGLVPISHSLPGGVFLYDNRQLLLAAAVTCWLVTDARPAFAFVIAQLLTLVLGVMLSLTFLGSQQFGSFLTGQFSLPVALGAAIMPLVVWLVRRQTAPGLLSPP